GGIVRSRRRVRPQFAATRPRAAHRCRPRRRLAVTAEVAVERMVLLHDHDEVLDRGAGRAGTQGADPQRRAGCFSFARPVLKIAQLVYAGAGRRSERHRARGGGRRMRLERVAVVGADGIKTDLCASAPIGRRHSPRSLEWGTRAADPATSPYHRSLVYRDGLARSGPGVFV